MTDLSPKSRAVIDKSRAQEGPSDEARKRMRTKLAATMGVAFTIPLGAGLVRSTIAKVASASLATKVVVTAALVTSAALVGHHEIARTRTERPAVSRPDAQPRSIAPRERATPATATVIARDVAPTNANIDASTREIPVPRRAPSSAIQRETTLVSRADRALRDGQPASALVLIEEHRAQFAHGQLAHERDALEVLAWCAVGRPSRARYALSHIDATALSPSLRERIDASCASNSPP